jgi:hypothetical protein
MVVQEGLSDSESGVKLSSRHCRSPDGIMVVDVWCKVMSNDYL